MNEERMMEILKFDEYFKAVWKNKNPLACLFRSDSSGYVLDTGTNKIMACSESVFHLLRAFLSYPVSLAIHNFLHQYEPEEFLKAAAEIQAAIEEENILRTTQATQFGLSDHFKDVKTLLQTEVQSINLEVSQDCNLRCGYCIYNTEVKSKRDHGHQFMSLEVAKKAIDYLKANSSKSQRVGVGFYGGEPLVCFHLIKECVTYIHQVFGNQKPHFNMTSNGTLITPTIAEYLLQENFAMLISMDGPEAIHNQYRKDQAGNGSFQAALLGLKNLCEAFQKIKKGSVAINLVYAPPYSQGKLEEIVQFFKEVPWLPRDINITATYPTEGTIPLHRVGREGFKEDKNMSVWAFEKYRRDYEQADSIVKNIMEQKLARLIQRPILKTPYDCYNLNGCCVPGHRKNYISTDGYIHVCEKISTFAPVLGHVDTGLDFETIKKLYIHDYAEKSLTDCATCWAVRMCDICYNSAINDQGEFDLQKKQRYCQSKRNSIRETLREFVICMEENPQGLDYLYQMEIS